MELLRTLNCGEAGEHKRMRGFIHIGGRGDFVWAFRVRFVKSFRTCFTTKGFHENLGGGCPVKAGRDEHSLAYLIIGRFSTSIDHC